jgi:hypothetical protein
MGLNDIARQIKEDDRRDREERRLEQELELKRRFIEAFEKIVNYYAGV